MDVHNISETMLNNNYSDNTSNKVYINPYFNRAPGNNNHNSAAMHVNPRFSHFLSNIQPKTQNKGRIYVNPNFRKSTKSAPGSLDLISTTNINFIHQNTVILPHSHEQPKIAEDKKEFPLPIAQSRYSLVRQNVTKALEGPMVENIKNTFQVSKYKSIPLNDIKRNIDNVKNPISRQSTGASRNKANNLVSVNKKYSGSSAANISKNQFKLVNNNHRNIGLVLKNDKIKMRTLIDTHKKIQSSQLKLKKFKGSLKKNNIPCPMFRKFGKCLRKIRGKCEFLHDKKHVSICRKYIKGLCHDKGCLLSHDLTTKKMPTCYFYLQGTCTKPDCPYLHVKLNEKVKICPDFLKGYCDKGSKCLLRHVSIQAEKNGTKGFLVTNSPLTSKKKNTKVNVKNLDHNAEVTQSHVNSAGTVKNENSDYRYYQEHKGDDVNASETCEVIKPQRCKLGTLPSFIQL